MPLPGRTTGAAVNVNVILPFDKTGDADHGGTEDELLPRSRTLRDCFRKYGYRLMYREDPGGHDWDFWNEQHVIDWLPLLGSAGISSGNVFST